MSNQSTATVTATIVELAYSEGTSDKFYRVILVGAEMTRQYGRTGTFGTFTPRKANADAAAAAKASDKAIAGKMAKGYQITRTAALTFDHIPTDSELDSAANLAPAGSTAEVSTPQLREQSAVTIAVNAAEVDPAVLPRVTAALAGQFIVRSGASGSATTVPMLAQIASKAEVKAMLTSPQWVMQPKLDGDRVLILVEDGVVSAFNRSGQPKVKNVGDAQLTPFRSLMQGRWIFDGEVVGRTLHLFDLVAAGGFLDEQAGFANRYAALEIILTAMAIDPAHVALVATATGEQAKREMLQAAEDGHKEGVIFRNVTAAYRAGRTDSLMKFKFIKEVDAVVIEIGKGGKENAVLAVFNEAGEQVIIGQVSTLGKRNGSRAIEIGDVVETQFLYITSLAAPVLFQPTILRVRTDKAPTACFLDQLAQAVTDKTV